MPIEIDTIKVKKGYIVAVTNIPNSYDDFVDVPNFAPKTITKIMLSVLLTAGASLTITIQARHNFPLMGDQIYEIYSNEFVDNGIIEITSGSFQNYSINIVTDVSTTGRFYAFFEYDYDLIK